ncbi:conserved hypothetical protein [uncultured spirochete]|jgi:Predicted DNA-binding proteins|uniref:UPF0251 protein SPIROBIBN47_310022 n=2 Tax=Spirochaetales TaxID=136 RepID=A0A3P3XKJ2_9SPIR|nr:conserved hypothetical protein [uncultured spirochete]
MPRPMKYRIINGRPITNIFKPAGIPQRELEEVILTLDELEALRLADLERKYQEDAAKLMGVSRQTFGNIIASARKKVADVLVNGKALRIEGGFVDISGGSFVCLDCRQEWNMPSGSETPHNCPHCGSSNIRSRT